MANKLISQNEVKTQVDKVLWHLQNYGTITSFHAYSKYRITRLASCIEILRNKRGYTINTEYVSHRLASDSLFPNAKNSKGTHAKYKYVGVNAIDSATEVIWGAVEDESKEPTEESVDSRQVDLTRTFDKQESKGNFLGRVFSKRK